MNYCPDCGALMEFAVPAGDDRKRNICTATGDIFYDNPRNIVGCIVRHEERILLCKRAIAPRLGFWTLPAGFLELGESLAAGAARETREEACAEVAIDGLFSLLSIPHIGQVHLYYSAQLQKPDFAAGQETAEVRLVTPQEIPWRQLAFPTVFRTLELYCAALAADQFELHEETIARDDWQRMRLDSEPLP
ncbi:MAG TPA: NUDIX hydrolase [Salinisphaeraceae bacterium]|nr:NUDIX hydrolase [Salinisphaeraceae bacterium]